MLYLGYFHAPDADTEQIARQFDAKALADGLVLVETAATRSRLYHALKRALPADAPLLVAPLADAPKFKGMAPGALNWVRARSE